MFIYEKQIDEALVRVNSVGDRYKILHAGGQRIIIAMNPSPFDINLTPTMPSDRERAAVVDEMLEQERIMDNRLECERCHTRDGVRVRVRAANVQPRLCGSCHVKEEAELNA